MARSRGCRSKGRALLQSEMMGTFVYLAWTQQDEQSPVSCNEYGDLNAQRSRIFDHA